jgi:hypothetical protein
LDHSLSMAGKKWTPAVNAIKSFVEADQSKDLSVGLQYFPIPDGTCAGTGYDTPAVAVGLLPAHAQDIKDSLDAHKPDAAGTPIEGALRGATEFCMRYQDAHSGEKCAAVLVTDGQPALDGCQHNTTKLADIAKRAHGAGVTTFAVGLAGANFGLLNEIAMQGGAPDCDPGPSYACDVSASADKLIDALATIRDKVVTTETHTEIVKQLKPKALACEWTIPAPTDGSGFDPNLVNVRLTTGAQTTMLTHAASREACDNNTWYFDDPSAPKRLIACPTLCSAIEAAGAAANVDILLGCPTVLN